MQFPNYQDFFAVFKRFSIEGCKSPSQAECKAVDFQLGRKADFARILTCQYVGAHICLRLVGLVGWEGVRLDGIAPRLAALEEAVRKRQNDRAER